MEQRRCEGVTERPHVEIAMPDGCRLAARIWMPDGAEDRPVPAILEYLPYRKNDGTLPRDALRAPWIAEQGYAYVRLDLRGTGESEGVMKDEYLAQELQDGCDAIAWLAEQPWCDGNVGMVGISWGGFNGLQIAALQPPALKAIVTLCSTDDRYADDIHYMGGAMLIDQISWASHMFAINTLPPDPVHVGERWRDMWMDRLKGSGLWLKTWLQHQTRDDYWKHGSICEDYANVSLPVYAVGGWADGYCRTVFRLMENLPGPKKGLVGPWAHKYPHIGVPGPAIDWLTEEVRWWDHWLKGRATGIMEEPQLRLYLQDHAPPASWYAHRNGRWIEEPSWPSRNVERTAFHLGDGTLSLQRPKTAEPLRLQSPMFVGLASGKWCSYALPGDQPADQRREDAGSLVFETEPLTEQLDIAGDGRLTLMVASDRPVAQVTARLMDVAPDGAATRVSYGILNLTHRDSDEDPQPLQPGKGYPVTVPLKHVAQTFRGGHRLRLSISTIYFPMAWPAPEAATLTIDPAQSVLDLPVRRLTPDEPTPRDLGKPQGAPPMQAKVLDPASSDWVVTEDLATGTVTIETTIDSGRIVVADTGLTTNGSTVERYSHDGHDHASFRANIASEYGMSRGEWSMRSTTVTEFTATPAHFKVRAQLTAWEGSEIAHQEEWDVEIPRNLI